MDTLIGVLQKIRYSKGFLIAMYGVQEPIRNLKIILKYFNSSTWAFRVNKVFVYKMYNCHGSVCPSPSPNTTQALTWVHLSRDWAHLHSIIITHTWPPSGNPPHLLLPSKLSIKLHSFQTLIVWSWGYKLFICFITYLLDHRCAVDVFLQWSLLKGEIRTTNSSVYRASFISVLLHLPVEVAFSLLNKEALTLLLLMCLSIQCVTIMGNLSSQDRRWLLTLQFETVFNVSYSKLQWSCVQTFELQ